MWEVEVRHQGLNRYRMIRGRDKWVVDQKAEALRLQWADQWARQQARDHRHHLIASGKDTAAEQTQEASDAVEALKVLLQDIIARPHLVNWDTLKRTAMFDEPKPQPPGKAPAPLEPKPAEKALAKIGLFEHLIPALKRRAVAAAAAADAQNALSHTEAMAAWENACADVAERNAKDQAVFDEARNAWQARWDANEEAKRAHNAMIDGFAQKASEGEPASIATQVSVALTSAAFPEPFGDDFEVEFDGAGRSCLIDFILPSPEQMPTLREVRYVQSRHEFTEKHASDAEQARLYDETLYKAALAILHIAFACDSGRFIARVTLNGWVDYVDKATGMDERSCILSLATNRDDLERVDLGRVDPKACFKAMKGVAASRLIGLAPVAPLQLAMAPDNRFVASQDVASQLDNGVNIAAMDWKDFEHLVRQVFENEFSTGGAEVRVTQASRDGGVDAIVHDPDPIRGGKIVIQAKRYINTVEVAAVRDLYGTVMNEGATKGILVTTSQFGPDARKFAQGKPLTLIDGGNFLHLLERMGMRARIDLKEARAALAAN